MLRLLVRLYRLLRMQMAIQRRIELLRRYGATLGGTILFVIGGAQMTIDNQLHVEIALGGLVLLVSATVTSWELLIRVARTKYGKAHKSD
jgi:hypothetical protein